MNNLQDAINQFQSSKLGKLKDGKLNNYINGINSVQRLTGDKNKLKQSGRRLGSTVGKLNMTDYTREMSKVPTTCPNCNTVGPLSNMVQHHMDNCKRTVGYSDDLIIENYKIGKSVSQISKESNVSKPQIRLILNTYKKNGGVLPVKKSYKLRKKMESSDKKRQKEILHNNIMELKLQGYSQSQIVNKLNTSNGTVCRVILNYKKKFGG